MLTTTDVAYLVALIEKAPSNYPRRHVIIEHLQDAWRRSARVSGNPWHLPIEPSHFGVVSVTAAQLREGAESIE